MLPDAERLKKLEQKVVDELGEEACSRMPLNLRITEPERPSSATSAPSSQSSSDMDSANAGDEENDENRMENGDAKKLEPGRANDEHMASSSAYEQVGAAAFPRYALPF